MPKVTVIIPSYNCKAYIAETIDSILNQTFRDIELIVVDDGSTDRTQEIVESYGEPVRLIRQTNARVCAARNRGIREAKGEFICLMDHDDYWYPEKLLRQIEEFTRHPEAGVIYSTFIRWHQDKDGYFPPPASYDRTSIPDDTDPEFSGWIYHQFLLDCWMLTSSAMFRREVFEKCGMFDEALPYSEDWELWLRISREYPMMQLRRPATLYRQHPLQGNRIVRDIDYRTELLISTEKKWGLCSRDGRCITKHKFRAQLASYHAAYGLHHLLVGNLNTATESLLNAWKNNPLQLKYLAYIAAGFMGWKPNW